MCANFCECVCACVESACVCVRSVRVSVCVVESHINNALSREIKSINIEGGKSKSKEID